MEELDMDKQTLRRQIREQKRAMTSEQIEIASKKLGELFAASHLYQQAKTIYGYLPYNQEVRTVPMLQRALEEGKRVAVPKCYGEEMRFIYMDDLSKVESGYCGIPEPIADTPVADDPTALVLMPGLAFTKRGERMGYGGGFYDKFLSAEPDHPTLALCYEFQMVEHIPTEEFDVPVDCVLWA
jgi:5-formyltetrahydrofolate cyclo-ligase